MSRARFPKESAARQPHVDSNPPPPEVESRGSVRVDLPLGHQISSSDQAPKAFVVRLSGIEDTELQRREAHITEMGNSPLEDLETRRGKSFGFMNALWDEAENVSTRGRNAIEERMRAEGKEFSEFIATAIVFMNFLTKSVLDAKCVSCQVPVGDSRVERFFPIEIAGPIGVQQHANALVKLVKAIGELPPLSPDFNEITWPVHREVVKVLDENFLDERDEEVTVLSAIDWCDSRLALKPKDLKAAVELCGRSYVKYLRMAQVKENAASFDKIFSEVQVPQFQPHSGDVDISTIVAGLNFDFNFDL
jgi:hypothetical protein